MSLIRSFVRSVMEVAEALNEVPADQREIVKRGAKNLAAAYTTDLFRAADFLVNVTNGVSAEAVLKLVMPASFEAIAKTNEEFSKVQKTSETTEEEQPREKPAFTLSEKGWANRPNPYIPTPSARD